MNKKKQSSKSPTKKKQEKVNWKEIMGMNMQTLHKRNGAWRRK